MWQLRFIELAVLLALFSAAPVARAESPLKSSLQPGDKLTTIFEPLNVTGPHAGEPHCLVCENGRSPVAMVFARDLDEPLLKLIAKIDAATAEHQKEGMGSFVVFLSEQADLPKKIEEAAKKHKLKHTVLSTFEQAGPEGFGVSQEAAVTVVLYSEHLVRANHAFRKAELSDQEIEKVMRSIPKIFETK